MENETTLTELEPVTGAKASDGADLVRTDGGVAPLDRLTPEQRERVESLMSAIDLSDSASILAFGAFVLESAATASERSPTLPAGSTGSIR